jgi:hypothetical protein
MKRGAPMKRTPFKAKALQMPGPDRTSVPVFKPKRCDKRKGGCGEIFTPTRAMQAMCGQACALNFVAKTKAKAQAEHAASERKLLRERKEQCKRPRELADDAQTWVNRYVRLRDAGKPCISCGTRSAEKYHAGHFLSRGARPELRFHLDNIHLQCEQCNYFGAGKAAEYRVELIKRIGLERVEWLEGPHPLLKLEAEMLRALKAEFMAKCKEMKKAF